MRQYIVLSQADIITLLENKPVSVYMNDVKYIMCSDECYEQNVENDDISHIFDNITQEEFEKIAKELTGWDTEKIRKEIQGEKE